MFVPLAAFAVQGAAAGLGVIVAAAGAYVTFRPRRRTVVWSVVKTPGGRARVVSRSQLANCQHWKVAFAGQRKDARFYEIIEETILQGFDYHYIVLENEEGQPRAIQPIFLLDQDLLAGTGKLPQSVVAKLRRIVPRLLKARTLMVGCTAGEGHLDGNTEADRAWAAQQLHAAIKPFARDARAGLVVLKEFHADYRAALKPFADGFTCVPSLPMTKLNIDYADFDDYMTKALSKVTRKSLRRKLRDADESDPIELQILEDISPVVDEIYPLYLQVYDRSSLHFEKLTKPFLCELGRRMPDKVKFFVWRQKGRAIAFSLCLVNGDSIYDEYLGLDYSIALDLHLYFYTFRDILRWAIKHGLKWYASSALNYDPKLHFKSRLVPLDLYVAHTSPPINWVLGRMLPLLEPTRNDKTLKQFPNFDELWSAS